MHGCASLERSAKESTTRTNSDRAPGISTVRAALETVQRLIGWGLRGAGAGRENGQRDENHGAKRRVLYSGTPAAGYYRVLRHGVPPKAQNPCDAALRRAQAVLGAGPRPGFPAPQNCGLG